jgi:prevent-host-death family protein
MERIGVRELRQHASGYLARVAGGESLEVTDRGRAVAHLVPIRTDLWEDLLTTGRVSPAEDPVDVADEAPGNYRARASAALAAMRAEER